MILDAKHCPKCGNSTTEERCRFHGNKTIPDKDGNQIRTSCPTCGFIGYRPVDRVKN